MSRSTSLMLGIRYPTIPTAAPARPAHTNISEIPVPIPVPVSQPNTGANLPAGIIAGPKTLSASGPDASMATGTVTCAMRRRTENTRPCSAGGTLDCQMAWLLPFRIITSTIIRKEPAIHTGSDLPRPMTSVPNNDVSTMPMSTPFTLRFGPPHAVSRAPPTTPPTAAADCVDPVSYTHLRAHETRHDLV